MIQRALDGSYEIWAKAIYHKNLCDFDPSPYHAAVLLNRLNITTNITLEFPDLFDNALSPHPPSPKWSVTIRDLWLQQDLGDFTETW